MILSLSRAEGQRGSAEGENVPVVVQTVLVIQLQIVPDEVLLGNRDTCADRGGSTEYNESPWKICSNYKVH